MTFTSVLHYCFLYEKVQSPYSVWHQRMRTYAHTLANADIR